MIAAADDGPTTEQILAAVDAVQDEAIDFLRSIVSIDSTLDNGEGRVQDAVYDHLVRVLGDGGVGGGAVVAAGKRKSVGGYGDRSIFEVTRHPVRLDDIRHRKGYSPVDWDYGDDQKFNVVARYPGRGRDHRGDDDDGRDQANKNNDAVLLVGHVDVVPASASDGWTDDPFSPVVRNGRMYGRGVGDMKAGIVAMVYAIVALRDLGYAPGGGGGDDMHGHRGGVHGEWSARVSPRFARRPRRGRREGGDGQEDGGHNTGTVPLDSHRPTGRVVAHRHRNREAMPRPIDVERIERHRGSVRDLRFPQVARDKVQRAEGGSPSGIPRDRPSRELQSW